LKVSIVTACRNRANTIAGSVHSVMSQTYDNIEHVIVDGASTDGTLAAIEACHSTRISKLVSEKDRGCYEGLNKAIRLTTGDIVSWLHSDDVYFSDTVIADVVKVFEETGCDFVYGDGIFVSVENPAWIIRDWVSGKYSDSKMQNGWLPLHTTVFVRRDIFDRFGYYREDYRISSDTFWLLKCMYKTGIKIEYLKKHVVVMGYGGLSTSWEKTLLRWREDLGIYIQMGISPRTALFKKIMRKVPQFLKAPFSKVQKIDRANLDVCRQNDD